VSTLSSSSLRYELSARLRSSQDASALLEMPLKFDGRLPVAAATAANSSRIRAFTLSSYTVDRFSRDLISTLMLANVDKSSPRFTTLGPTWLVASLVPSGDFIGGATFALSNRFGVVFLVTIAPP